MAKNTKHLGRLFTSNFYLSAFTFGGGYVIVSLMKKKYVDELKWLEEQEMLDITAIAQSCPGALAVNASVLIGYRLFGLLGAAIGALGTTLPPLLVISVLAHFYAIFESSRIVRLVLMGMQVGVAAVVVDVVITMIKGLLQKRDWLGIVLMVIGLLAAVLLKINVILIILSYVALGIVLTLWRRKRTGGAA